MSSKYVIGVHGYILVYSVTSRNSFNMVQNVYNKILDFGGTEAVPCVIVGSKTDLETRYLSFFFFCLLHEIDFSPFAVALPIDKLNNQKAKN